MKRRSFIAAFLAALWPWGKKTPRFRVFPPPFTVRTFEGHPPGTVLFSAMDPPEMIPDGWVVVGLPDVPLPPPDSEV